MTLFGLVQVAPWSVERVVTTSYPVVSQVAKTVPSPATSMFGSACHFSPLQAQRYSGSANVLPPSEDVRIAIHLSGQPSQAAGSPPVPFTHAAATIATTTAIAVVMGPLPGAIRGRSSAAAAAGPGVKRVP